MAATAQVFPPLVRVASIPAGHPYVQALGLEGAGARLLPDPPVTGAPPGQWWPPAMLDPAWIAGNRDAFDVMHLHFGFESLSLAQIDAVLASLRAAGRPLIYTVHDLSHPQLHDQRHHQAQLRRLVQGADALITLTPGAAAEIRSSFGRRALVVGHPALLARDFRSPSAQRPGPPVIGLPLRDLRPSIDGPGSVSTLLQAATYLHSSGIPARVRVTMRDHVRDPAAGEAVRQLCADASALGVELREGPRPGDSDLANELSELAACLLPYRHGTHSGWLELCWDLGVPILVPSIGHLYGQHPDDASVATFSVGDAGSIASSLARVLARPEAVPGSAARERIRALRRSRRERELVRSAEAHMSIYRSVIAAGSVG